MFRGSTVATIDDKGRLKVPTDFRRALEERFGAEFFITSVAGDHALVYPLPVWEEIEGRLAGMAATDRVKERYLERVNYYGQQLRLDNQGRLLVPAIAVAQTPPVSLRVEAMVEPGAATVGSVRPSIAGPRLRDTIPGARLVVVPAAGHFPFLEQPEVFQRELRAFLATVRGGQ